MKIVVISEKTQQKMLVARMLNEDPLLDNIDKDAEKKKKEKELEKKKDDKVIINKDEKLLKHLNGKEIKRKIFINNKLINIII